MAEWGFAASFGRPENWARIAILGLTLLLCCVLGLITPYLLVIVGVVLLLRMLIDGTLLAAYRSPAARLFLAAFVILAICFVLTAKRPQDPLMAFNFTMLLLYGPFSVELLRGARPGNSRRVAMLALGGTILALLAALLRIYLLGEVRADSLMFGAILLGNTAILLGFLSLIGVMTDGKRNWIFFAGPVIGIIVVLLTASRGPLLALVPLLLVASFFVGRHLRLRLVVLIGGGLVVVTLGIAAALIAGERFTALVTIGADLASGAPLVDGTARIRLVLYEAAFQAFLQSPWLGYGWTNLISAVVPFLTPENRYLAILPQLHNDIADFAVAAGAVGVAVYFLLIATPIVAALRSPRDKQYALRLFGCMTVATAYFFDGLTDLMFGFEFHTALYVCLTSILLGYCRATTPVTR